MTPPGRDKNIDSVLKHFDTNMFVTKKEVEAIVGESERHNTISQMLAIGIFQLMPDTIATNGGGLCYILTAFGIEVKQHGSWTKYLADKEEEKEANRKLIASSTGTNNLQKILLWITVAFTAITLFISILDYSVHREELRLEQNRLPQTGEAGQRLQQSIKTVDPNSDSLANPAADSLQ